MSGQILFTDLDDTLLNDRKEVTPGSRRAIEAALARGKRIVVASGRPLSSALIQARRLELAGPGCFVIAYNGAVIYDCTREEAVSRRPMAREDLYAVFDEARRRGAYAHTYDREQVVIEERCDRSVAQWYCGRTDMTFRVIGDVRRDLAETPVKTLVIDREDTGVLEDMERWLGERLSGRVDFFRSSPQFLEMVTAGVNKGWAVEELCRRLGIPIADAVAAGDEANDISMLRAAGVGAAMCNGIPAAKEAADYVTQRDNNHDGIAEVIERFLL